MRATSLPLQGIDLLKKTEMRNNQTNQGYGSQTNMLGMDDDLLFFAQIIYRALILLLCI